MYISGMVIVVGEPDEELLQLRTDIASLDGIKVVDEAGNQRHLLRQHCLLGVCEEYCEVADCVTSGIQ